MWFQVILLCVVLQLVYGTTLEERCQSGDHHTHGGVFRKFLKLRSKEPEPFCGYIDDQKMVVWVARNQEGLVNITNKEDSFLFEIPHGDRGSKTDIGPKLLGENSSEFYCINSQEEGTRNTRHHDVSWIMCVACENNKVLHTHWGFKHGMTEDDFNLIYKMYPNTVPREDIEQCVASLPPSNKEVPV